jgi:hypothetical protein
MHFDIIIPYHKKDEPVIHKCVQSCKYLPGGRNVYVVSEHDFKIDGATTILEKEFPFTKQQLLACNPTIPENRIGWYFQQFIKLYSFTIPEITDTYLVLDSDVVFLNSTNLLENNLPVYNYSSEYTDEYFQCMKRLNNYFERSVNKSGICHFMMFEKNIILEIFDLIKNDNQEIYDTILKAVRNWHHGFSEYELYFHYIFKKYPKTYNLKQYKYLEIDNLDNIQKYKNTDINYIAYHSWKRK